MPRVRRSETDQRLVDEHGPDFSEALARGLRVIAAFGAERPLMTLADVAREVDLPRATVRRALYTLDRLGYVRSDGRLFQLTPKVLSLATAYLASNSLSATLQQAVERVAAQLNEACSAAILDGDDIVFIARAGPTRRLGVGVDVGYRIPAYCSSMGRVLLGGLDEADLAAFLERIRPEPLTPQTLVDRTALRGAIHRDRERGYSLVDQEAEVGYRSLAVPVRRYDGRIVCALNAGANVDRVAVERMLESFLPVLREAAAILGPQMV
ncbi:MULTISPECIES: IclR family transcriptional regulator domain-containing protein [Methylobacterium]|uniref:IclR family transcriptional regulator domain-containing protein n=1 Tax=Methylobacterium TaxID=407 RepID=UPI0013ED4220|nr:IclR family transcriptional regulator C-terminal domain-containing protein [Methylobacterium sp. DB0501]NGM34161.1 helix-turn-helix domain-containing protein [Methylobacterium sp. DB0501]